MIDVEGGPDLDGGDGGGCRGRDRALLGESGLSLLLEAVEKPHKSSTDNGLPWLGGPVFSPGRRSATASSTG
jgi:hypothetical protein